MFICVNTIILEIASQMWLLGRLLPLMVGQYVPDDDPHWMCFMELLSILVQSTAVEVTGDSIADLRMVFESYLFHYSKQISHWAFGARLVLYIISDSSLVLDYVVLYALPHP